MDLVDSMFLFEIIVEKLTSYSNCKEFCIKSQFADVFSIDLKDPNETTGSFLSMRHRKLQTKRKTVKKHSRDSDIPPTEPKVQTGQSILFENNVDILISHMKQYPMELSLCSKVVPEFKIGSTHIPWSTPFYDYLSKLHKRQDPVCVIADYNVFDEITSKRMAVIKLNVKFSCIKYKVTTESLSQETQQTVMFTALNSKLNTVQSPVKDKPINLTKRTGIIKNIYSGEKRKVRKSTRNQNKSNKKGNVSIERSSDQEGMNKLQLCDAKKDANTNSIRLNSGIVSLVRSDINLDKNKLSAIIKSKSCSSINQHFNIWNYIFGDSTGPFGNQVYCVGYFTVQNEFAKSPKATSSPKSPESAESVKSPSERTKSSKSDVSKQKQKFKFKICDTECPSKKSDNLSCTQSVCSLDLPQEASHLISLKKCDSVICDHRQMRKVPTPPDDRILIDLSNRKRDCCEVTEKVEEVVGGIKAQMKFGDDPCYCECECIFEFTKKTTFCNICGGYEVAGEEYAKTPYSQLPYPCPIYHKIIEKGKMKTLSTSGSESKKKEASKPKSVDKVDKIDKAEKNDKADKIDKSSESDKETTKKGKKKKKDDRFKFNYGYTAPQIGHIHCGFPCTGVTNFGRAVPKKMGWLWNAEDVPGMKYRPSWKPGASNKHVVRLLKLAKNPEELTKRRKTQPKAKRPLKRPLLIVHKKDGEYSVTMETMRTFTKPRTLSQYPYEDKPLVTYTIGRTSEENLQRRKKKERLKRRLERLQRDFIQSAFKDMCQDICLKTYQQALGILPDAEHPDCPCYPAEPGPDRTDLDHSCSCSEDKELSESDTDSDEWIVEFTPPNATFDPTFKSKKVTTADNTSQYSYMDYRVKLLDRYGNPVPRFFRGPDGKQQCSDLGGFWDPDHKWQEINIDGFIGPDERWAPHLFMGPDGEQVDAEAGKFQAMDGQWLVVGVDGYVDPQGKWKFYPKPKSQETRKPRIGFGKQKIHDKKEEKIDIKPSEATWSCFGTVSPKVLSKMGIVGHGHDKKLLLSTLKNMLAQGKDVKIPQPSTVPRSGMKLKRKFGTSTHSQIYTDRGKCKHGMPSDKGVVAVDGHGNKTYFKLKQFDNRRPKQRIATLTDQGISLSSFHVPCFHSFISSEIMKKQQYDRLVALSKGANTNHKYTTKSTQKDYVYVL